MMSTQIPTRGLADQFRADQLNVYVYETRAEMGDAAAEIVAGELRRLLRQQEQVAAIFASAPPSTDAKKEFRSIAIRRIRSIAPCRKSASAAI